MFEITIKNHVGSCELDIKLNFKNNILVLFGPSGSGKTLTLKHIAGFIEPKEGFIRIKNKILFDSSKKINIVPERRKIGYVLQNSYLFPHLSIKQNLFYAKKDLDNIEKAAIIDLLDLNTLLTRCPANLSGGEQQRVAIGRALLSDPEILLMDEPLNSLDADSKWRILEYIKKISLKLSIPIIYVTHSLKETDYLADNIGVMNNGSVCEYAEKLSILNR